MKETVGFIGLGGMGLAIAANLLKAGFGLPRLQPHRREGPAPAGAGSRPGAQPGGGGRAGRRRGHDGVRRPMQSRK